VVSEAVPSRKFVPETAFYSFTKMGAALAADDSSTKATKPRNPGFHTG